MTGMTATTESKTIPANGLDVHYLEAGSGHPLILLHGGMATASSWGEVIPQFAQHFRVLAPDTRAHGRTGHTGGDLNFALLADDVAACAGALGRETPLICGFSDGGQTAMELGMRHPDLAGGLVISGATHRFVDNFLELMAGIGFEAPGQVNYAHVEANMAEMVNWLRSGHTATGDPDYWRTLLRYLSTLWLTPLDYTPAQLAKISVPALVLVGDRDEFVSAELAVELYRAIPGAELGIVANTSHENSWGEVYTQIALEFLLRQRPLG